ncbi:MAG: LL-diaminopimelate aminotransferase [Opitutales bacterium]|nr:LL-diaminopimelate aminotransferase [Opitutales bacterium]
MSDSFLQKSFAERIGGANYGKSNEIYKFERIKRAKRAAVAANPGKTLIDMGVGEPDDMAFPEVVKELGAAAARLENRGYADNGCADFKRAVSAYMKSTFSVEIDAEREVVHSMGSKAALSILPNCFINPGDVAIMTVPGYPIFGTHAKYLGGAVYNVPLKEENGFLPELKKIPEDVCRRAKTIVVNYPNNPTGASATLEFFEELVDFAKKNEIVVISDAAYSSLSFDEKPLSIFQIDGAKDVALELHSLSKSHNMTGWRIGWVCGNPLLVKAYADVKDNTDSGQFLGIQYAAKKALESPQITRQIAQKYSRRMDLIIDVLKSAGFSPKKPKAGFFLYLKIPKSAQNKDGSRAEFKSAEDFSKWMISELLISTVPWDDAGAYARLSATFEARGLDAEKSVAEEIRRRLLSSKFEF